MRISRGVWTGGLVTLLALVGCSESKTAEVSGTVTVDGQLVKRGSISFIPTDGNTPTAGGPIKDGHYSVMVPITAMKVKITAPKVIGKRKLYDTPDSKEVDVVEEGLPAKYNQDTELTLEVKPGQNHKDFALQSN